jgi:Activator of Hsp90 ATPase homolog 1-like protein
MHRIKVSTTIEAPRARVWRVMLEDATYRKWTSAFQEGSYAVTDWKEGSKAQFLTPEGNGMFSKIVAHRPNEFLSIMHLGTIKNGVEVKDNEDAKGWAGAMENYTLREAGGRSTLTIEMDVTDEHQKYFEETWPKALRKLKEIAEAKTQSAS